MLFLLALIIITGVLFLSGTNIKIYKSVEAEVQITVDNTSDHPIEIAKPITTAKSNYKLINPIPEGLNILSPTEIPKVADKFPVPQTLVKATNTPQTQIANSKEMVRSNNRTIPPIKSSQPTIKNKRNTPTTNMEVSSLGNWEEERLKPWKKLARPYQNRKENPRIGVVIYGLGTSAAATRSAIQGLPGAVTLAFSPYTSRLGDWIDIARAASHEVLIMITPWKIKKWGLKQTEPQQPINFESNNTLNVLSSVLSREKDYIGVTNYFPPGSNFETRDLQKLFQILKEKGLLFLESRPSEEKLSRDISNKFKLPFAANKIFIDNLASRTAIRKKLEEAEQLAQSHGEVIVMGFFYPVTLELLVAWTRNLDTRGFSLAPISALAKL